MVVVGGNEMASRKDALPDLLSTISRDCSRGMSRIERNGTRLELIE